VQIVLTSLTSAKPLPVTAPQRYGMTRSLPPLLPTAAAMSAASGRIHLKPRPRSKRPFPVSFTASSCLEVPVVRPQAVYSVSERLAYNLERTSLPTAAPLNMFRPVLENDTLVELADLPQYTALPCETSTRKEYISSPTSLKYEWPMDDCAVQKDCPLPYIPMFNSSVSGIIALQPRLSKRMPFLYATSRTCIEAGSITRESAWPTHKQVQLNF
jgi:hypothetical protein